MSKIKIIQNRYDTLKDANKQLKFNYKAHHDMLPLLQTNEEKMKANDKLIKNFRENILDIINLRKQKSTLTMRKQKKKLINLQKKDKNQKRKNFNWIYTQIYI